ncbi:MAG: Mut7-C RNAse domain-containing protein [Desulfotomaculales bacterium]
MQCCVVRFYAELNDFLPREKRQVAFEHRFFGRPSVKDIVESLGVPHTEVDLVLINGESVEFSRQVNDGDYISVYPVFESLDISPVLRVRPAPLRETRFLLDAHLGKLAAYLRMLGFDAQYEKDLSDEELAEISVREHRILLTRDRGLLKRSLVTHGYLVRSSVPAEQAKEILQRFDLFRLAKPFRRCTCCNETLKTVAKEEVQDRLPPKVLQHFSEFNLCQKCGRVYWKGSHYENMKRLIGGILTGEEKSSPLPLRG